MNDNTYNSIQDFAEKDVARLMGGPNKCGPEMFNFISDVPFLQKHLECMKLKSLREICIGLHIKPKRAKKDMISSILNSREHVTIQFTRFSGMTRSQMIRSPWMKLINPAPFPTFK